MHNADILMPWLSTVKFLCSRFSVFLFVFHGSSVDRQHILSATHLFSIIITFYLDLFVCPVMITTDVHRTIKMMLIADKVRQ